MTLISNHATEPRWFTFLYYLSEASKNSSATIWRVTEAVVQINHRQRDKAVGHHRRLGTFAAALFFEIFHGQAMQFP